jgi:hypothetical protein
MKISFGSLELGAGPRLDRLFGPKQFKAIPLNQKEIDELTIYSEYRKEINSLHGGNAYLTKDIDDQYWLGIRGTGFGNLYTVAGLGEYKGDL